MHQRSSQDIRANVAGMKKKTSFSSAGRSQRDRDAEERIRSLSLSEETPSLFHREDPRQVAFILNPVSGHGTAGRRWDSLVEPLVQKLFLEGSYRVYRTQHSGHARELVKDALTKDGYNCVVSIGGDGTHGDVLNGYLQSGGAQCGYELAILPFGTGGDFQRTLNLSDLSIEELLLAIRDARSLLIDAGHVTYTLCNDPEKKQEERYFLNISSCGISGAICNAVENGTKKFGGFMTFFFHTCLETLKWSNVPVRWRIVDNGQDAKGSDEQSNLVEGDTDSEWRAVNLYQLVVANGRYFGGGVFVAPMASLSSSSLVVVEFRDVGVLDVSMLPRSYTGSHVDMRKVRVTALKGCLEVQPPHDHDPVLLEIDGEIGGQLPAKWRCVPRSVHLVVPDSFCMRENISLSCSSHNSSDERNEEPQMGDRRTKDEVPENDMLLSEGLSRVEETDSAANVASSSSNEGDGEEVGLHGHAQEEGDAAH